MPLASPWSDGAVEKLAQRLYGRDEAGWSAAAEVLRERHRATARKHLNALAPYVPQSLEELQVGADGHRVEIEFYDCIPIVRLIHPEHGCPKGEEGEDCWLTDWVENEGAELLRGKVTLPIRWEQEPDRDHPLFHLLLSAPTQPNTGLGDEDRQGEVGERA
jgi:hypothetical protein